MKEKKYATFYWFADDEGGTGICLASEWNPHSRKCGYYPETGWRAQPSILIGYFDTAEELAKLWADDEEKDLLDYERRARENTNPNIHFAKTPLPRTTLDEWLREAKYVMENYKNKKGR